MQVRRHVISVGLREVTKHVEANLDIGEPLALLARDAPELEGVPRSLLQAIEVQAKGG